MKAYDELIIDGETIHFDEYHDMELYLEQYLQGVLDNGGHKDEIIAFYTRYNNVQPEDVNGHLIAGELFSCISIDDWADEEGGYLVFRKDLTSENRYPEEVKFFGNITLVDYVPDEDYEASTKKGIDMNVWIYVEVKDKWEGLKGFVDSFFNIAPTGEGLYDCIAMVMNKLDSFKRDFESLGASAGYIASTKKSQVKKNGYYFDNIWENALDEGHNKKYHALVDKESNGIDDLEVGFKIANIAVFEYGKDNFANEAIDDLWEEYGMSDDDLMDKSTKKTKVKTMKKATKKSLLEDGDHKYLGGMDNGDTVDVEVDGFTFTIKCEVDYEGDSIYTVYETFSDGISDEICDVDDGMSVSEIKDTIRANADWDDIQRSTRKSINIKNKGRDSMRNMKKSALLKELEDIDEECEGKDCEDKKETFRRATRKDEEPDSKRMLQDDEISEDELREKCARARKRHLARTSRKGMRKADSAEPAGTIVDEVEDPEQVVSGNKESETPKETIVDEVEDPEELDSETHGAEQEGSVVDEVVDPEQLDKIRRAKIRRALAKRRMQKARMESTRKSPRQVRKFSVATRGSERYDGRQNYNQSPMMRQAIDNAFPKEDETVKSLNARLDAIRANSRNKVTNPIGKKRIH